MKVLLINPPTHNMIGTNVLEFVDTMTGCYPPLGLMYIAASVEKYTNYEIKIIDAPTAKLDYRTLEEHIIKEKPDIVGITVTTFTLIDAILTVENVNKINSSIHVCLGGPHVNIYPLETIQIKGVDSVILGEGEFTFVDLLNALERDGDLHKIKNIVFIKNGEVVNNFIKGQFINNLDLLPFPSRHLVPFRKYYSILSKKLPMTTMITSRGCPYRCTFCDRPHLGKKFRSRSAQNIINEFEICINMGIKEIFIYDDTFTINRQRVIDICDEIIKRKLDIVWDIRARIDTVDKEVLIKLKRAGCARIHYGIEAGTQEIIEVLKKNINLEQANNILKMTKELGIVSLAYFMIGNPTEDKEQIKKTIDFAIQLKSDYVHFSITTPFPGTELYKQGLSRGIWKNDFWQEFAKKHMEGFIPKVWEEKLSRAELVNLLKYAYRKFYFNPQYILKEFIKIRSFQELMRKINAGIKVILS